jgi:hypothetical protein
MIAAVATEVCGRSERASAGGDRSAGTGTYFRYVRIPSTAQPPITSAQ